MNGSNRRTGSVPRLAAAAVCATFLAGCAASQPTVSDALIESDREAMRVATQDALENFRVGEPRSWSNEATGARGTVIPIRTIDDSSGRPCREFQQTASRDERTAFAFGTACRDGPGSWEIVDYSGLADERYAHRARHTPRYDPWYYDPWDPWWGSPWRYGYPRYAYGPRFRLGLGFGHRF